MPHYVYRVDVMDTNFYYIGKRSTNVPIQRDHYTGSGALLLKYPASRRKKTIISEHSSSEEAYAAEKLMLGDLWKTDPNCLNQKPGGKGAPAGEDHHWFGKSSAYNKSGKEHHSFGKKRSAEDVAKISTGLRSRDASVYLRGEDHPGFGKPRSEETKAKISQKNRGRKLAPFTEEHKTKISKSLANYVRTPEHQEKINKALEGKRLGNKQPPPLKECCWCHREIDIRNFSRYHGDKCKFNPALAPKID